MQSTSVSLLQRLHQPEARDAWARFVRLYTPLLFYWARRLARADADAADLVQDVFVTLVQKLPAFNYEPGKGFRGWLRTVLTNKWRERCRRRAPQPVGGTEGLLGDLPGAEDEAFGEAEYRRHLVQRALELMQAEFPPKMWQACWAYVVEGRPAAEVAKELGIATVTVYVAKSRREPHYQQLYRIGGPSQRHHSRQRQKRSGDR
jgi:RNA polymerase sigma-70 factor, ECF subfamily